MAIKEWQFCPYFSGTSQKGHSGLKFIGKEQKASQLNPHFSDKGQKALHTRLKFIG